MTEPLDVPGPRVPDRSARWWKLICSVVVCVVIGRFAYLWFTAEMPDPRRSPSLSGLTSLKPDLVDAVAERNPNGGVSFAAAYRLAKGDFNDAEVQLLLAADGPEALPLQGKNLVVIAQLKGNDTLHFRLFDGEAERVADTDGTKLQGQDRQKGLDDIKRQLAGLWPPHKLTDKERRDILGATKLALVGRPIEGERRKPSDFFSPNAGKRP